MTENEEFLVGLLKMITRGCRRHVYYKGKQPPKMVDCHECQELYKANQRWLKFCQLNEIEI